MPSYLDTEPDLDEHESIEAAYPSESYLVRREDPEEDGVSFRFVTPAREPITFDDETRATLFADLFTALGGFRIKQGVGEYGIPVTVAAAGKPAIASYMYAVWGQSATQIASTLKLDRETVIQYFDRIRSRAADEKERADESETPPGEAA
ncbi:MAG: hypothetical protein ABEI31_06055 [Halodesulfurarchaeum sp.]